MNKDFLNFLNLGGHRGQIFLSYETVALNKARSWMVAWNTSLETNFTYIFYTDVN